MQWVEENVTDRKQLLPELLNLVRLPELPAPFLLDVVRCNRLIVVSVLLYDSFFFISFVY